jgi:thiosulfate/3-mercaptopyruvate sulfurtransferase
MEINTEIGIPGKEMFVDSVWLADHLKDREVRIVDLRFNRCFSKNDKVTEECLEFYKEAHIPGAVYIDCIKDLTDPSFKDIFYVPPPEYFAEVMGRVGIGNNTIVVCYDEAPYPLAAARFWWTMLYFGHKYVKILDGGIRKWVKEGRSLSDKIPQVPFETFTPRIYESVRMTKEGVKKYLFDDQTVIIDCLRFPNYSGRTLNTWSIRKGHIPGAVWLSPMELVKGMNYASPEKERDKAMFNDEPYAFFPKDELCRIFAGIGVKRGKKVIVYCGKGDAACSVFLALKMVNIDDVSLYDGSLAEWSRDVSLTMEVSS